MAYPQARGRKDFITGLRDAHALEKQGLALMKRQVERLNHYPQLATRLNQHLSETREHLRRLDDILRNLGEDASMVRDAGLTLVGNLTAFAHAIAQDEVLKNLFANFAFECYEIAAYSSLIRMADLTGNTAAIATLGQTLQEERAMAKWLDDNIANVTTAYLTREQLGIRSGTWTGEI